MFNRFEGDNIYVSMRSSRATQFMLGNSRGAVVWSAQTHLQDGYFPTPQLFTLFCHAFQMV